MAEFAINDIKTKLRYVKTFEFLTKISIHKIIVLT